MTQALYYVSFATNNNRGALGVPDGCDAPSAKQFYRLWKTILVFHKDSLRSKAFYKTVFTLMSTLDTVTLLNSYNTCLSFFGFFLFTLNENKQKLNFLKRSSATEERENSRKAKANVTARQQGCFQIARGTA